MYAVLHFRWWGRGRRYYNINDEGVGTRSTTSLVNVVDTGELDTQTDPPSDQGTEKVVDKPEREGERGRGRGRER